MGGGRRVYLGGEDCRGGATRSNGWRSQHRYFAVSQINDGSKRPRVAAASQTMDRSTRYKQNGHGFAADDERRKRRAVDEKRLAGGIKRAGIRRIIDIVGIGAYDVISIGICMFAGAGAAHRGASARR